MSNSRFSMVLSRNLRSYITYKALIGQYVSCLVLQSEWQIHVSSHYAPICYRQSEYTNYLSSLISHSV